MKKPSPRIAPRVYVAAPFTKGDQWANVRRSVDAAQDLRLIGFLPFNPLLAQLGHFVHPMTYEEHLAEDLAWLIVCDAVFRVPGDSDGADRECALARALRIPVFTDLWTLTVHFFPDRK